MTEETCISHLLKNIADFKQQCSNDQITLLNRLWPKTAVQKYRIGVMKLLPKVHKLTGDIDENSWKFLPSRPIRGAELDPMKHPFKGRESLKSMINSVSCCQNYFTWNYNLP